MTIDAFIAFAEAVGAPSHTSPNVTDWMQGIGALLAVPIAIWAAWLGREAKKTSKKARSEGRESVAWAVEQGNSFVNERLKEEGKTVWEIRKDTKNTFEFTNGGSQTVKLRRVKDVSAAPADAAMLLPGYEGQFIDPRNSFRILVEKSLASAAVTKVEVEWEEGPRTVTQIYAVS